MKPCICAFVACTIFLHHHAAAQATRPRPVSMYLDLGFDFSCGSDRAENKPAALNPNISFGYYSAKRFQRPGIRFRSSLMYGLSDKISTGIQIGFDARVNEVYNNTTYCYMTIPVQLRTTALLAGTASFRTYIDLAGGLNFFQLDRFPETNHTGMVYTTGISFLWRQHITLRTGFEQQLENCTFTIKQNPALGMKAEKFSYRLKRQVMFLALGWRI